MTAALASPRWDASRAAAPCLRWLQRGEHLGASPLTVAKAAGALLHRIVREPAFAASAFGVLDAWREWVAVGGMARPELELLHERKADFAAACVLLGLIGEAAASEEGVLAADMRECIARWKTVRLG